MNQAAWIDRRPLVASYFGLDFWRWYDPEKKPAGWARPTAQQVATWFNDRTSAIIATIRKLNAQGVIFWTFPLDRNGWDYAGDLKIVHALFPQSAQKQFVADVRAACPGVVIGFCLRPGITVSGTTSTPTRVKAVNWVMGDLFGKIKYAIDTFCTDPKTKAVLPAAFYIDSNLEDDLPLDPRTIVNIRNAGYPCDKVLLSFEHWRAPRDGANRGWYDDGYFYHSCGFVTPTFDSPPLINFAKDAKDPPVFRPHPYEQESQDRNAFYLIKNIDMSQYNPAHEQHWITALRWGNIPMGHGDWSDNPWNDQLAKLCALAAAK